MNGTNDLVMSENVGSRKKKARLKNKMVEEQEEVDNRSQSQEFGLFNKVFEVKKMDGSKDITIRELKAGKQEADSRTEANAESSSTEFNANQMTGEEVGLFDLGSENTFCCLHCVEVFTQKGQLQEHYREYHAKHDHKKRRDARRKCARYMCNQCTKHFADSWTLKHHKKTVHLAVREHTCDQCSKSFLSKKDLKRHFDGVHLRKRIVYPGTKAKKPKKSEELSFLDQIKSKSEKSERDPIKTDSSSKSEGAANGIRPQDNPTSKPPVNNQLFTKLDPQVDLPEDVRMHDSFTPKKAGQSTAMLTSTDISQLKIDGVLLSADVQPEVHDSDSLKDLTSFLPSPGISAGDSNPLDKSSAPSEVQFDTELMLQDSLSLSELFPSFSNKQVNPVQSINQTGGQRRDGVAESPSFLSKINTPNIIKRRADDRATNDVDNARKRLKVNEKKRSNLEEIVNNIKESEIGSLQTFHPFAPNHTVSHAAVEMVDKCAESEFEHVRLSSLPATREKCIDMLSKVSRDNNSQISLYKPVVPLETSTRGNERKITESTKRVVDDTTDMIDNPMVLTDNSEQSLDNQIEMLENDEEAVDDPGVVLEHQAELLEGAEEIIENPPTVVQRGTKQVDEVNEEIVEAPAFQLENIENLQLVVPELGEPQIVIPETGIRLQISGKWEHRTDDANHPQVVTIVPGPNEENQKDSWSLNGQEICYIAPFSTSHIDEAYSSTVYSPCEEDQSQISIGPIKPDKCGKQLIYIENLSNQFDENPPDNPGADNGGSAEEHCEIRVPVGNIAINQIQETSSKTCPTILASKLNRAIPAKVQVDGIVKVSEDVEKKGKIELGLSCDKCGSRFINDQFLQKHMKDAHPENKLTFELEPELLSDGFHVIESIYMDEYDQAVWTVSNDPMASSIEVQAASQATTTSSGGVRNVYSCDLCEELISTKAQLAKHKKIVHKIQQKFKCDSCDKCYSSEQSLRLHRSSIHEGVASVCYLCLKPVIDITRHIRLQHTKKEERKFTCQICNKSFRTNFALQRHTDIVHLKLKLWPCDLCEKSYASKRDMLRHKKHLHLREPQEVRKEWICPLCNISFEKRGLYDRHKTEKHINCSEEEILSFLQHELKYKGRREPYLPNQIIIDKQNMFGRAAIVTGEKVPKCTPVETT